MDVNSLRKLNRLLISEQGGGTAEQLAKKLGRSPRQTKHLITILRNVFNCPIGYCTLGKTYCYTEDGECLLEFKKCDADDIANLVREKIKKSRKK